MGCICRKMTIQARRMALSKNQRESIHQLGEGRRGSIWVKKSFRGRINMKMDLGCQVKEYNLGISIFLKKEVGHLGGIVS